MYRLQSLKFSAKPFLSQNSWVYAVNCVHKLKGKSLNCEFWWQQNHMSIICCSADIKYQRKCDIFHMQLNHSREFEYFLEAFFEASLYLAAEIDVFDVLLANSRVLSIRLCSLSLSVFSLPLAPKGELPVLCSSVFKGNPCSCSRPCPSFLPALSSNFQLNSFSLVFRVSTLSLCNLQN
ncbi:hypothetical protein VNO77_21056 [Canavalia gladiata]|uniref:Uncharacterized protein n=1 Tax=Canavalia gladiata TaxID=3824 RepID=A0AAN9QLR8_CANGL